MTTGRVLNRTARQIGTSTYELALEIAVEPAPGVVGEGSLYLAGGGNIWPDPIEVYVNGTAVDVTNAVDDDTRIELPDGLLMSGANVIAVGFAEQDNPPSWIGGNPAGLTLRAYLGTDDSGTAVGYSSPATTKTWEVQYRSIFTPPIIIGGEPAGWQDADFDDAGWAAATAVGTAPYGLNPDTLNGIWPPTAPATWVASFTPTTDPNDNRVQSLIWLARVHFEIDE